MLRKKQGKALAEGMNKFYATMRLRRNSDYSSRRSLAKDINLFIRHCYESKEPSE